MSNYQTEEEQVAALKEWWKENGTAILVGVSLGLALLFGWQAWQKHKKTVIAQSSSQYTTVLEHLQAERFAEVVANADLLIDDYKSSPYAALSSLAKVKAQLELNELDKAISSAEQAVELAKTDDIKAIAHIRLAQLYLDKEDHAAALAILDNVQRAEFVPQANVVRGDIQLASGDTTAAIAAYKEALDAELNPQLRVIATLKYENLAGKYEPLN